MKNHRKLDREEKGDKAEGEEKEKEGRGLLVTGKKER